MGTAINSLTSYMAWVQEQRQVLNDLNSKIGSFTNSEYQIFFRGVSRSEYEDIPSIFRDGLYCREDVIFNEALSRNCADFASDKTTFDMLVRMQHYNVPTRLLDITSDPLVALYFATRKSSSAQHDTTGKVIVYFISQEKTFYSDSPKVCLHANLARCRDVFFADDFCEKKLEQLAKIASKDNPECQRADRDDLLSIYCVKPRMNNPRIIRQKGAFLLFGQILSKVFPSIIQPVDKIISLTEIWTHVQRASGYANAIALKENGFKSEFDEEIKAADQVLSECWDRFKEHMDKQLSAGEFLSVYRHFTSDLNTQITDALSGDFSTLTITALLGGPTNERTNDMTTNSVNRISYYTAMRDIFNTGGSIGKTETTVDNKSNIAKELENYGITEGSLFPELYVLGKSLREKYKRKDY